MLGGGCVLGLGEILLEIWGSLTGKIVGFEVVLGVLEVVILVYEFEFVYLLNYRLIRGFFFNFVDFSHFRHLRERIPALPT